jgi:hypothetical protein
VLGRNTFELSSPASHRSKVGTFDSYTFPKFLVDPLLMMEAIELGSDFLYLPVIVLQNPAYRIDSARDILLE